MSRSLGSALPPELLARFSQTDLPSLLGRGLPFLTLAADGTLHPMLCSYLEWLAVDARTLRLAIAARSRSARNLEERGVGTLLLVEPGLTIYIKCRATGAPLRLGELARFTWRSRTCWRTRPPRRKVTCGSRAGSRMRRRRRSRSRG